MEFMEIYHFFDESVKQVLALVFIYIWLTYVHIVKYSTLTETQWNA